MGNVAARRCVDEFVSLLLLADKKGAAGLVLEQLRGVLAGQSGKEPGKGVQRRVGGQDSLHGALRLVLLAGGRGGAAGRGSGCGGPGQDNAFPVVGLRVEMHQVREGLEVEVARVGQVQAKLGVLNLALHGAAEAAVAEDQTRRVAHVGAVDDKLAVRCVLQSVNRLVHRHGAEKVG